ncbi:hypothetical protein ANN_03180, partial [Periplaneta americana]
ELRLLAFNIAERNETLHRFSEEKRIAGKKWYYVFKRRLPQVNLRQPQSTSYARAKGFDKENVKKQWKKRFHYYSSLLHKCCVSVCSITDHLQTFAFCERIRRWSSTWKNFAYNPESGYISKDVFVRWLRHFIDTVRPSKEREVLLLLDGHSTHTRNLDSLDIARENGVIMLALPGHTTHRLQSLDVSCFKHLSKQT